MEEKPFKRRPKHHKKQFKPRTKFRSGDPALWIPELDTYTVLEVTDKADCGIQILKIKSMTSGTEFYVHEDVLHFRR